MEYKEINIRSWVVDILAILIVLAIIVGIIAFSGVQLEVYPTNTRLALKEDFNDSIYNVNIKQDGNYLINNLTIGKLVQNSSAINKTNLAVTMIEIKNPDPTAKYIKISFDAKINTVDLKSISYNSLYIYGNLGLIGIAPSNSEFNSTPYTSDIIWSAISNINTPINNIENSQTVFDSFTAPIGDILNGRIGYYPIVTSTASVKPIGSPIQKTPNTPYHPYSIYRTAINPAYTIGTTNWGSNPIQFKIVNTHVQYVINYRHIDYSYVEITYQDKDTGSNDTVRLPLQLNIPENPDYLTIFVLYNKNTIMHGEELGLSSLDNVALITGDVVISEKTLATSLFVVFGFLLIFGMSIYALFRDGLNSGEAFLLGTGIMLIILGIASIIMPTLIINPANAVLTISTFALLFVWLMFRSGKINFKGQIDEWLGEHGDALFFGMLVLTIIQYVFGIFS